MGLGEVGMGVGRGVVVVTWGIPADSFVSSDFLSPHRQDLYLPYSPLEPPLPCLPL